MTSANSSREQAGRFVAALFNTGDRPDEMRGALSKFRGDASQLNITSFVQNDAVIKAAENYLREIRDLWNLSCHGRLSLDSKVVFPSLVSTSTNTSPATATQQQRPQQMSNNLPDPNAHQAPPQITSGDASKPPLVAPPLVAPPLVAPPLVAPPLVAPLLVAPPLVAPPLVAPPLVAPPLVAPPLVAPPLGSAAINQSTKPGQLPAGSQQGKPVTVRATFHLPNAKAGQPYNGKLEGKDATGKPVVIRDAILSTATGLTFDSQSSEVRGTPAIDGDHKVAIRWTSDNVTIFSDECILIVNPDPRSLWKVIDPPLSDPYYKPNTEGVLLVTPNYKIAAASRRGRSHEHVGSFRDDDYFVKHDEASGWSVLIVADGAGSAKSSRWGSKLAVEAAGSHILSQLTGAFGSQMIQALAGWSTDMTVASKSMSAPFYLLFQEASKLAVQAIESEAQSKGVPPKDYSTTLLATVVRRDGNDTFLATFWMGDGAIAAYGPREKVRLMGTPDSGEFAGQTRFLDRAALNDQGFGKRLGLGRYSGLSAVILMTDGISDPRFETDNGLADAANWDALWDEINPHLTAADPASSLVEWLNFFTPGHHDDRTIAVLW